MLGEQIESILFSMKAGDLTGVLVARDGFHILKIERSRRKNKIFRGSKGPDPSDLKERERKSGSLTKSGGCLLFPFPQP